MLVLAPAAPLLVQLLANVPGKAAKMAQVFGSLTCLGDLVPGSGLALV